MWSKTCGVVALRRGGGGGRGGGAGGSIYKGDGWGEGYNLWCYSPEKWGEGQGVLFIRGTGGVRVITCGVIVLRNGGRGRGLYL